MNNFLTEFGKVIAISVGIVLKFMYAFDVEEEMVEFDKHLTEVGLSRY